MNQLAIQMVKQFAMKLKKNKYLACSQIYIWLVASTYICVIMVEKTIVKMTILPFLDVLKEMGRTKRPLSYGYGDSTKIYKFLAHR
jgi:hypothetical protein